MANYTDVLQVGEGKAVTHILFHHANGSDPLEGYAHSVVHFLDGSTLTIYSDQYDYYEAKK